MKKTFALSATAVLLASAANAATERDLEAHVHGSATLDVAIDGQQLYITLESPWANLVGFEHEPSTDEQRAVVDEALHELEHGAELFAFGGAECVLARAEVDSSMGHHEHSDEEDHGDHEDETHEHSDEEDHGDHEDEAHKHSGEEDHDAHQEEALAHDHDEKHEHEEQAQHEAKEHENHGEEEHAEQAEHQHEEHAEHEDHDHAEGETHSSVLANYVFDCADMNDLETLSVRLFDVWGGFEDVDVQFAGPGGQGAAELAPGSADLDLTPIR